MDTKPKITKNIVVIDDNLVIRHVIKRYINTYSPNRGLYGFYCSDNGVEGLGYVFATEADLVVIDFTLPKLSGKEMFNILVTNGGLLRRKTPIILIHDNIERPKDLPAHIILLDKDDKQFLEKLLFQLDNLFELKAHADDKPTSFNNLIRHTATRIITLANRTDIIIEKAVRSENIFKRIVLYTQWFFSDLAVGFNLFIFNAFSKKTYDVNIEQANSDLVKYRVRYYTSLVATITTIGFLIIELLLLVTGGIVLFNVKLTSIFAAGNKEETVNLTGKPVQVTPTKRPSTTIQPTDLISLTLSDTPTITPTDSFNTTTQDYTNTTWTGRTVTSTPQPTFAQQYPINVTYPLTSIDYRKPKFTWSKSLDPSLGSYYVYLDNVNIASVDKSQNEYQYTGSLGNGSHTLRIAAIRLNGSTSYVSTSASFNVVPINTTFPRTDIDSQTPTFSWVTSSDPGIGSYYIYLDGVLIGNVDKTHAEYQHLSSIAYGTHTWKVVAHRTDGSVSQESNTITFNIMTLPVSYPKGFLDNPTPTFSWSIVDDPAIASYKVYLDGSLFGTTSNIVNELAYSGAPLEGVHSWKVTANKSDGTVIYESVTETFLYMNMGY